MIFVPIIDSSWLQVLICDSNFRRSAEERHGVFTPFISSRPKDTVSRGIMSDVVLEIKNLTRRFGAFTAVDAFTLSVNAGEVFGLLGSNGAGTRIHSFQIRI
jgi:ABC-type polysaccharide/polyol phosphate transport system ATPase subunit